MWERLTTVCTEEKKNDMHMFRFDRQPDRQTDRQTSHFFTPNFTCSPGTATQASDRGHPSVNHTGTTGAQSTAKHTPMPCYCGDPLKRNSIVEQYQPAVIDQHLWQITQGIQDTSRSAKWDIARQYGVRRA